MTVFFFAVLHSFLTVIRGYYLFGLSLGTWLVSFIVFDFLISLVVFKAKNPFGGDSLSGAYFVSSQRALPRWNAQDYMD